MDPKKSSRKVRTLAAGLIVGGAALSTFTTTGCDNDALEQVASIVAGAADEASELPGAGEKMELLSRLAANHNETFLISAVA